VTVAPHGPGRYDDGVRLLACIALAGLVGAVACIVPGTFSCEEDAMCGDEGICHVEVSSCSYPDTNCSSGRRFSDVSSQGPICVELDPDPSDDDDDDDDDDDSGLPEPIPGSLCGNEVIDAGETCDDGNREEGDGCNAYCIEPGGTVWETLHDSEDHEDEAAVAIALDPDGTRVAIAGRAAASTAETTRALVQTYDVDRGELGWSAEWDGGPSEAKGIAFAPNGDLVAVGSVQTEANGTDLLLLRYRADGSLRWSQQLDHAQGDDIAQSVVITPDDVAIVVGDVIGTANYDAWVGRFDAGGTLIGEPLVLGGPGRQRGMRVVLDGQGRPVVTGGDEDADGTFTARTFALGPDDEFAWDEVHFSPDNSKNADRGVGLEPLDDGGVVVAGTIARAKWIQFYGADGTPGEGIEWDDGGAHDEATAVVPIAQGGVVTCGVGDFGTADTMSGGAWIARHDAALDETWTVIRDEPGLEKALGMVDVGDGSAIIAGYVTRSGQGLDVWLRKVAI